MRESARRLLAEAGYVGAGTVEFMLDPATGEFYFLEVNARLQVEHPVTEAITGIDLVQWQIRIANGESLPDWPTDRSGIHGHAIEARIVAEDPGRGFLPSLGKVLAWSEPKMPGVRVDSGFVTGSEVSQFYDSLLAKVIAHGATRDEARRRLIGALREFHVLGVRTNIAYLLDVLDSPGFAGGDIDTGFLGREFGDWSPGPVAPELEALLRVGVESSVSAEKPKHTRAWDATDGFRNAR
jgi:3-methylcrotonyl-CoA carboxylase alpha subunit